MLKCNEDKLKACNLNTDVGPNAVMSAIFEHLNEQFNCNEIVVGSETNSFKVDFYAMVSNAVLKLILPHRNIDANNAV